MHKITPGDFVQLDVKLDVTDTFYGAFSSLDAFDMVGPFKGVHKVIRKNERLLVVSVGLKTAHTIERDLGTVCALLASDDCRLWYAWESDFKCVP